MTAIELEYITLAYICPAALAVTIILCACALLGWRRERWNRLELCRKINQIGALAEFNKALREETDAWRELESEG